MATNHKSVRDYIRTIVDFPHEGIMFRDVTTLFADPRGFMPMRCIVDSISDRMSWPSSIGLTGK